MNKLQFPRYIYGMLLTPDKNNVYGDLQPIAYSVDFPDELKTTIYEKIKLGLNRDILKETGEAYGFFAISKSTFVSAHYQLMNLTEPTSRGKPIFAEYLYITEKQIIEMGWNLLPVFGAFSKIEYYDRIVANLQPVHIRPDEDTEWIKPFRHYSLQREAILLRYLASDEKVNIISATIEPALRWQFLCSLLLCLPERYRYGISFSTLASDTSEITRIFFSDGYAGYGQVVDWSAPEIQPLPGAVYSNWVTNLVGKQPADHIEEKLNKLRLPLSGKKSKYKTIGAELDDAIEHKKWVESIKTHLDIKVPEQLEELYKKINEFSCFYNDKEIGDWLTTILTFVMKLNAYKLGTKAISDYSQLLSQQEIRQNLVKKIIDETLKHPSRPKVAELSEFLVAVTQHAEKSGHTVLIEFCQEILFSILASENYRVGMEIWVSVKQALQPDSWIASPDWYARAIAVFPDLRKRDDFVYLVETLVCPPRDSVFRSLYEWLQRSPKAAREIENNLTFLAQFGESESLSYLQAVQDCYSEVKSPRWLVTQLQFLLDSKINAHYLLYGFFKHQNDEAVISLLRTASQLGYCKQAVSIAFSLAKSQVVQKNTLSLNLLNTCLQLIQPCTAADIKFASGILSGFWREFSPEQLEVFLNLFQQKDRHSSNLSSDISAIKDTIRHHKLMQEIMGLGKNAKDNHQFNEWLRKLLERIFDANDAEAWEYLEKNVVRIKRQADYQKYLPKIVVESMAFGKEANRIEQFKNSIFAKGLRYEVSILAYWLISQRYAPLDNLSEIIRDTLTEHSQVSPILASAIIGTERCYDKSYASTLANYLLEDLALNAYGLLGFLEQYLKSNPVSFFASNIMIRFGKVDSEDSFTIFIQTLTSQFRLAIKKREKKLSPRRF